MQIFYLANVGTRDVTRNADPTRSVREDGQRWFAEFDTIEKELEAPILLPGLQHVLRVCPPQTAVRVVLFYSDQDVATTEVRYLQSDTLHFASILQKLLPLRLGNTVSVQPVRIEGNPADYNKTLAFFKDVLQKQVTSDPNDVVYIAPVGGADASNVGLAINAVRHFRDRCQFIYVLEKVGVQLLNLHAELLGDYSRREANAHLTRRDYAALEQTLRQSGLGEPWHQRLCAYADCRTRFDFQRACTTLDAERESGEVRLQLSKLCQELQPFLKQATPPQSSSLPEEWDVWFKLQQKLLAELYFNLRRKAMQREWVDFLSRLFRLQEAVLRLVFETETKHSTYKHAGTEFADFRQSIVADVELSKWFKDNDIHFEEPNSRNLFQMLRYWVEEGDMGKKYGKLYKTMKVIGDSGVQELRNQSIAAHGYQGVSQSDVESKAKKSVDELLNQVKQVVCEVGENVDSDPYDEIDTLLKKVL